jgi:hypothetical protein
VEVEEITLEDEVDASNFVFTNIAEDSRPGDRLQRKLSAEWRTALNVDGKQDKAWSATAASDKVTKHANPVLFPLPKANPQVKVGLSTELSKLHRVTASLGHAVTLALHKAAILDRVISPALADHPDAQATLASQFPDLIRHSDLLEALRDAQAMTADLFHGLTLLRRVENLPNYPEHADTHRYLNTISPSWDKVFYEKDFDKFAKKGTSLKSQMEGRQSTPAAAPQSAPSQPFSASGAGSSYRAPGQQQLPAAFSHFPKKTKFGALIKNPLAFYGFSNGLPTRNLPEGYTNPQVGFKRKRKSTK